MNTTNYPLISEAAAAELLAAPPTPITAPVAANTPGIRLNPGMHLQAKAKGMRYAALFDALCETKHPKEYDLFLEDPDKYTIEKLKKLLLRADLCISQSRETVAKFEAIRSGDAPKDSLKVLYLTLHKEPFELIASGKKTDEYREIKPFFTSRLEAKTGGFRAYDAVYFTQGYGAEKPAMLVRYEGTAVGTGRREWLAPEGNCYIISLGDPLIGYNLPETAAPHGKAIDRLEKVVKALRGTLTEMLRKANKLDLLEKSEQPNLAKAMPVSMKKLTESLTVVLDYLKQKAAECNKAKPKVSEDTAAGKAPKTGKASEPEKQSPAVPPMPEADSARSKMTEEQKRRAAEADAYLGDEGRMEMNLLTHSVTAFNNLCVTQTQALFDQLTKSEHRTPRIYQQLLHTKAAADTYRSAFRTKFGRSAEWEFIAVSNCFLKKVSWDLTTLHFSVKNELDRLRFPVTEDLSRIMELIGLVDVSIDRVNKAVMRGRQIARRIFNDTDFLSLRLIALRKQLIVLLSMYRQQYFPEVEDVDLSANKDISLALQIIEKKYAWAPDIDAVLDEVYHLKNN